MNNMNPAYQEITAQRKNGEIEAELSQLRLQLEAAQAEHSDDWVAHRIAHLAEWMISIGESLRERYDHAAMHSAERAPLS